MSTASIPIFERAEATAREPGAGRAVAAVDLARRFDDGHWALESVSLAVATGEIHPLLGPDGAGKTTLLRILAGLTTPTTGSVEILGLDPSRASLGFRRPVGHVPARIARSTTASRDWRTSSSSHVSRSPAPRGARDRAIEFLARVGLAGHEQKRVGEYSSGMQKRLSIARALVQPPVLPVDEATHDLNPSGLAEEGVAVVWAAQRVEEIKGFAQRVTVCATAARVSRAACRSSSPAERPRDTCSGCPRNAAATRTFRRGGAGAGFLVAIIALGSEAYFPLTLLSHWLYVIVRLNPVAVSLAGTRGALIGGDGWSFIGWSLFFLALCSAVAAGLAVVAFRLALRRERRRGSLGLY